MAECNLKQDYSVRSQFYRLTCSLGLLVYNNDMSCWNQVEINDWTDVRRKSLLISLKLLFLAKTSFGQLGTTMNFISPYGVFIHFSLIPAVSHQLALWRNHNGVRGQQLISLMSRQFYFIISSFICKLRIALVQLLARKYNQNR